MKGSKFLQHKLFQLSARLGATLQREDGEVYANADDFPEPPRMPGQEPRIAQRRPAYEGRNFLWKILMYASIAIAIIVANAFGLG